MSLTEEDRILLCLKKGNSTEFLDAFAMREHGLEGSPADYNKCLKCNIKIKELKNGSFFCMNNYICKFLLVNKNPEVSILDPLEIEELFKNVNKTPSTIVTPLPIVTSVPTMNKPDENYRQGIFKTAEQKQREIKEENDREELRLSLLIQQPITAFEDAREKERIRVMIESAAQRKKEEEEQRIMSLQEIEKQKSQVKIVAGSLEDLQRQLEEQKQKNIVLQMELDIKKSLRPKWTIESITEHEYLLSDKDVLKDIIQKLENERRTTVSNLKKK